LLKYGSFDVHSFFGILFFKLNILKFQKVFPYLKSMAERARRPFRKSFQRFRERLLQNCKIRTFKQKKNSKIFAKNRRIFDTVKKLKDL
jgi:hypothetical protein